VIGLGAMGSGMAGSLRRAGADVHVCDVPRRRRRGVRCAGRHGVRDPGRARRRCDVVVSVVVNAAQTESVLFGGGDGTNDGDHGGVAAAMKPGSVFVMCSTVDPNVSIAFERRLEAMGLLYVDAPISGGAARAASGEMTVMGAARDAAWAVAEPFLHAMAAKVYRLGDRAGNGSKVKIINQLLAGVHIAAAAEAMALGLREGVDAPRSTTSSRTAPATAGCSRTAWRTCSRATTRRSRRSTSSSRTSASSSTPRARPSFRCRSRARRTRCSCRRRRRASPRKTTPR
jgi:3-hydroxyisobutyrate dehydrogenase